ncbi:hypothetical protein JVT61DRAFT_11295 [Boletus reticuloceps]|uniref:BTB domain-containing protein n=1 Tax=Boletus reticuloceps TaxID=495285 RepID=A0A8I2YER9_9AGAM|nr:hypothetical protein JVT61DRAFT_11295 [Boletus reticuloceps]
MTDSVYAAAPFDHAKADIILRSSDNIDFRVFKLFLSLASPFFETLFDIPQPAEASEDQEVKDGLAVVPVIEDSKTVDALLRFCYPCTLADDPTLDVLQDALDVLEAARKYSLDSIEKKARQAISSPKILEVEPLRCFAIAHRGRLREETLLAAKQTLAHSPDSRLVSRDRADHCSRSPFPAYLPQEMRRCCTCSPGRHIVDHVSLREQ